MLNTLKFYLPVAWKLSKRYFIVSVINVIVQAVLPFIDLIFLPLLVDALCQPERSVIQIILYAALMVGLDIAVGSSLSISSGLRISSSTIPAKWSRSAAWR